MPSDPLQKNLHQMQIQIQIQTETQKRERCPRCESMDTKFCYYNNYNTSQPRHFCRSCRRYWTLGGSLRSVPVGGSTRVRRFLPYPKSDAASTVVTPLPNHITAGPFSMGFDIRPMNVAAGREYAWPALSLFTEPSKADGGDGTECGQAH